MIAIIDYDAGNIKSVEKHFSIWDRRLLFPEILRYFLAQIK